MNTSPSILRAKRLGIDTLQAPVIYMHANCHVCRSEGFNALSRVQVTNGERSIIATLNIVFDGLVAPNEVGCSEAAWRLLEPLQDGQVLTLSHPRAINSLSYVRGKIYGNHLSQREMSEIVNDIAANRYTDVQLAAFVTACVGDQLNVDEITYLTKAMVDVGDRLSWGQPLVVDKHCVGGLPGNRTTPIVVAIVCAHGLTMPKTSSRAITSPAGTADTMETMAPVELSLAAMRSVVEKENGCIVWGGAVNLSPADDILIRVERALDLDSEGQLVASVLSKKI
ncbi:MAG TPA: thymidine phosphorylase, partial [Pseudomonadales bacterium]|nr:thymidine phosphorylase [Pseudomonadales bacterium]